jgi:hypothetical protein
VLEPLISLAGTYRLADQRCQQSVALALANGKGSFEPFVLRSMTHTAFCYTKFTRSNQKSGAFNASAECVCRLWLYVFHDHFAYGFPVE